MDFTKTYLLKSYALKGPYIYIYIYILYIGRYFGHIIHNPASCNNPYTAMFVGKFCSIYH
jgi:hypothetical protein